MKKVNMNFIPQNVAPMGAKKVAIFDNGGNLVATLPLGGLAHKHQGEKLYSFGALSDVHLPHSAQNASTDFQKALTYFNNVAKVNFICISGDMSDTGSDAEWLDYKNHVDAYSPNIPVHLSTGNHDTAQDIAYDYPVQYTGNPLWYSFEQNNDVFIMFGLRKWQGNDVFYNEALQWLYETLEDNKDKRCFVFQHEMRLDGCGNAHGLYSWDGLSGRNGQVFLSLMEHYKNVIWFHGHSHTPFKLQSVQPTPIANYDRLYGCHSVHIPSLAIPKHGNCDVMLDAEGYVVDVYENGIHLRGIDFIEEEFVPIASYWIDTTPIEIPANSYVDTKGVIKERAISLPGGSELIMNQRYSYSGNGLVTDTKTPPMFTVIIPAMPNTDYALKIKNSNIELPSAIDSVIYGLDSSKMPAQQINGGNIPSMTTGIALSEDKKSADITFTTAGNVSYIALSLKALVSGTLEESDITDYIIELKQNGNNDEPEIPEEKFDPIVLPAGSELSLNQRYSHTSNGLQDSQGFFAVFIPIDGTKEYTLSISNMPVGKLNQSSTTFYKLDETKTVSTQFNGGNSPTQMTTGATVSEDYKSAIINIPAGNADAHYLACSFPIDANLQLTERDLDGIVITLEEVGKTSGEITSEITWKTDTRLSSSSGNYTDLVGACASSDISCVSGDIIRLYNVSRGGGYNLVVAYGSSNFLGTIETKEESENYSNAYAMSIRDNGVLTITILSDSVDYIRVCSKGGIDPSTVRITKNMEL